MGLFPACDWLQLKSMPLESPWSCPGTWESDVMFRRE